MLPEVVQLSEYRERRSREKIFQALEILYIEALSCLEDEHQRIDPAILEEFFIQVIGDHLMGVLEEQKSQDQVVTHYHAFDKHLRDYLGHRLAVIHSLKN